MIGLTQGKAKSQTVDGLNNIYGQIEEIPTLEFSGVEYNKQATVLINFNGRECARIHVNSNNEASIKGQVTKYINKNIRKDYSAELVDALEKRGYKDVHNFELIMYTLGENFIVSRINIPQEFDLYNKGYIIELNYSSNINNIVAKLARLLVSKEIL